MTGNKNAWRAPLAGLASLAMIATMGVAASTANAEPLTVNLNGNGSDVTLANANYFDNDGDLKAQNLYTSAYTPSRKGFTFTGWYAAPQGGKAVSAQDNLEEGTTLYAHWASKKNDDYTVRFVDSSHETDWSGVVSGPLTSLYGDTYTVLLAPGDQLASWQYSTKDSQGNHHYFNGWKLNGAVVSDFDSVKAGDTLTADAEPGYTYELPAGAAKAYWEYNGKSYRGNTALDVKKDATSDQVKAFFYDAAKGPVEVNGWENGPVNSVIKTTSTLPGAYLVNVEKFETFSKTSDTYIGMAGSDYKYYSKLDLSVALPASELAEFQDEAGHAFVNWFTAKVNRAPFGVKLSKPMSSVAASAYMKADHDGFTGTVYGAFTKLADNMQFTFIENYAGGKSTNVTIARDQAFGALLPAPVREGYQFGGWYVDTNPFTHTLYDTQVTKDTIAGLLADASIQHVNVYAKWTKAPYAELFELLNLKQKADGKKIYTDDSWKDYQAAVKAVAKKYGVSAPYTLRKIEKLSAADAQAAADELAAAKAQLTVVPDLAALYKDVDKVTPHYFDIVTLSAQGVIKGYEDGTFRGLDGLNRQDFAAYLYRLAGNPKFDASKASKTFTDVNENTPHYKEILWAADNGIVKGYADGSYKGMDLINRQDAAAMLYRLAGTPDVSADKNSPFTDVDENTPHYAEVLWAASKGIVRGYADGTFNGYATIARQDAAAFLNRTAPYVPNYLDK